MYLGEVGRRLASVAVGARGRLGDRRRRRGDSAGRTTQPTGPAMRRRCRTGMPPSTRHHRLRIPPGDCRRCGGARSHQLPANRIAPHGRSKAHAPPTSSPLCRSTTSITITITATTNSRRKDSREGGERAVAARASRSWPDRSWAPSVGECGGFVRRTAVVVEEGLVREDRTRAAAMTREEGDDADTLCRQRSSHCRCIGPSEQSAATRGSRLQR